MLAAAAAMMLTAIAAGGASPPAPQRRFVVVFDFACPRKPAYGSQLADSVRLRLRRHKDRYSVIDRLSAAEVTPAAGVPLNLPEKKFADLLANRAGAHIGITGRVDKVGDTVRAEVRFLDVSGPSPAGWTKVFSGRGERARGVIARQIVEAVVGRGEWKPPEYGDEAEPKKFSRALNRNGSFEAGHAGWARPDNVSMRLVRDPRPGGGGKVLRLFTDLDRDAWLKYQRDLRLGRADPSRPPRIGTVANKYATVAGLEGVHYRSAWIDAAGGQRYWLVADMKGKTAGIFFPKIFVKGFADFSALADSLGELSLHELKMTAEGFAALPAERRKKLIAADVARHPDRHRREVYRWYLSCRNEQNVWKHYAAPFPPRGGLPKNVRWLRIEIYAYWPPGQFLFDDVHLYKDPRQKAPLPAERPRTPHYKPPSTRPK